MLGVLTTCEPNANINTTGHSLQPNNQLLPLLHNLRRASANHTTYDVTTSNITMPTSNHTTYDVTTSNITMPTSNRTTYDGTTPNIKSNQTQTWTQLRGILETTTKSLYASHRTLANFQTQTQTTLRHITDVQRTITPLFNSGDGCICGEGRDKVSDLVDTPSPQRHAIEVAAHSTNHASSDSHPATFCASLRRRP